MSISSDVITAILLGIFFIFVLVGLYAIYKDRVVKRAILKAEYEEALKGNDKAKALEAGRAYYSNLRNDRRLTIYDEQAIANDLSTMK